MHKRTRSPFNAADIIGTLPSPRANPRHVLEYFGSVNYATNERVLSSIKAHMAAEPAAPLTLIVTSPGGQSGIAMSFFDTVRTVLQPVLTTIAMGDVDSSGVIIFLSGTQRLVSAHTTLLLHPAGRCFDPSKRYTAAEIGAMAREDELKDKQYASILAKSSHGRLTEGQTLTLMECHTVLDAEDLVRLGLAHGLLE